MLFAREPIRFGKEGLVENQEESEALRRANNPVNHASFNQFVATISALRAPDGCPWDREQTHASIAHNMIEEAYEAVDAIESGDVNHLREELGDVLLQVVLQSQIAADAGLFTIDDVAADVNEKMVRRHPHIFGDASAADAGEVLAIWDKVKMTERSASAVAGKSAPGESAPGGNDAVESPAAAPAPGLLDGVPVSFPALMQAQKISRKAAAAGFEWDTLGDVWEQVRSEIAELDEAYEQAPKASGGRVEGGCELSDHVEEELGDVLFSLTNVARRMGVDSENALRASCRKFRDRWEWMEREAAARGDRLEDFMAESGPEEREELWEAAKAALKREGWAG